MVWIPGRSEQGSLRMPGDAFSLYSHLYLGILGARFLSILLCSTLRCLALLCIVLPSFCFALPGIASHCFESLNELLCIV